MEKRSILASLAGALGTLATLAFLVGPAAANLGILAPIGGFALFGLGMLLGGPLSLVLGLVGLLRTRQGSGRKGRGLAWLGSGLGALLLLVLAAFIVPLGKVPPIHDVTTDAENPPHFEAVAEQPANRNRDLSYPHGGPEVTEQQRQAYPEIVPIVLAGAPGDVLKRSRRAAEELGWTILTEDPAAMRLEAYDVSRIFRFVDDVVVRVQPSADGSVVDLRSTSRVGQSDLGANAARIRDFADALESSGSSAP